MNNLTTRIVANLWQPLHFFNNDIPYSYFKVRFFKYINYLAHNCQSHLGTTSPCKQPLKIKKNNKNHLM